MVEFNPYRSWPAVHSAGSTTPKASQTMPQETLENIPETPAQQASHTQEGETSRQNASKLSQQLKDFSNQLAIQQPNAGQAQQAVYKAAQGNKPPSAPSGTSTLPEKFETRNTQQKQALFLLDL